VGKIIPFPVYINPFPVSETCFETFGLNGQTFAKEVL
jgi:hypothetical protein